MRLFKGRADTLIEQHLEKTDLHPGWWPSAKAAIAYCEQGEWFEPVMSQDGVFAARDLVAQLELEPFVRGGVDWSAHRNPFLNDPTSRHFYDERLEKTTRRWEQLYMEDTNPTLSDPDLHQALVFLRGLTQESPNAGVPLTDAALDARLDRPATRFLRDYFALRRAVQEHDDLELVRAILAAMPRRERQARTREAIRQAKRDHPGLSQIELASRLSRLVRAPREVRSVRRPGRRHLPAETEGPVASSASV